MLTRSISEDITKVKAQLLYGLLPDLFILTPVHQKRLPKFSNKDS